MNKAFLVLFFLFSFGKLLAQDPGYDTAYIEKSVDKLIFRTYVSRKYTDFRFDNPSIRFEPNSTLNLGVGFTYQKFTLNLGVPVSFLNPNIQKDWPRFFDLQSHAYPQNWVLDFFGQFYKGYIAHDYPRSEEHLLRKDLQVLKVGVSANYVFNGNKLSLKAAFHQSEIQKKSAFSPMLGFEVYRAKVSGDSLLIPGELLPKGNFSRADFFHLGPSVGLAGTLVFGKGFFISGSASGNAGLGFSKADQDSETREIGINTGVFLRGFVGYNGQKFSINGNYVLKNLHLNEVNSISQELNTGNYRINLVYKFSPGPNFNRAYTKFNPLQIIQRMFD